MKNGVVYKNQNVYLKINIYLNQASTLRFRPVLPLYRNQSTDIWSKSMGWFPYIIFSFHETLFPQVSNLTRHTFHKSIKPRMQTENLANNNHKQFYVLLNNNQIKLYISWKKILYLKNFSTQNQQLTFYMRPFTTHIYYFSQRQFRLQQSLKPQNIAHITSSIVHMT